MNTTPKLFNEPYFVADTLATELVHVELFRGMARLTFAAPQFEPMTRSSGLNAVAKILLPADELERLAAMLRAPETVAPAPNPPPDEADPEPAALPENVVSLFRK